MAKFDENSRVKIPAILHLCRLGYQFLPLQSANWDPRTNIFPDLFRESLSRLNPLEDPQSFDRILEDIHSELDNEDLGMAFYQRLTARSGIKLIDFEDFSRNSLHVVTELPCVNDDEEFRPDITLLINGMPLAFIEVKKPNNTEGILSERNRINRRFQQRKFRRFVNISQILVYSNNMEYDPADIEPLQGAFYSTTAKREALFNFFREEDPNLNQSLQDLDEESENAILTATNYPSLKGSPEFETNKEESTPTHRLLTSLFCPKRLAFLLQYGIAYVKGDSGLEKHIVRYPQLFAILAIEQKLNKKERKGVVWHTQGSGKTALSYFSIQYLTDYFSRKQIVPKFYFIVDRIDLLEQAKSELSSRGLKVHSVDSKDGFAKDFTKQQAVHNQHGEREVTVVNIHKFSDDTNVLPSTAYAIETQRVYFLDEAHRSYNPKGSFLANLLQSDRNAIFVALTGTPLIGDVQTRALFGPYFHKYYYNASIADGYTLRLIREAVETNYAMQMKSVLEQIKILEKSIETSQILEHDRYVEPMLDYVVSDFLRSRERLQDQSIGGMVVCNSSTQAKKLYQAFVSKYNPGNPKLEEQVEPFASKVPCCTEYEPYQVNHANQPLKVALILHDVGSKEGRKHWIQDFKKGEFDLLIVYNMLLTGFDAKRLKKLYLGRVVKDHNLLQTLTRVNRPYKKFRYGYVVDFADISNEFDKTNQAYFKELNAEIGENEIETYSKLFKSAEEIRQELEQVQEILYAYDLENAEIFSRQISQIQSKAKMLEIKKALDSARELYNLIRMQGNTELLKLADFQKLNQLANEANQHLKNLNLREAMDGQEESVNLLNSALENVLFLFRKGKVEELRLADQLKNQLRKTREAFAGNFDKKDPKFTTLFEELKRLFQKKKLDEVTQEEMESNIHALEALFVKIVDLNKLNQLFKQKYAYDEKYARVHKRIQEQEHAHQSNVALTNLLKAIKDKTDEKVLNNRGILSQEVYFQQTVQHLVIGCIKEMKLDLESDLIRFIAKSIAKEYLEEFEGVA